MDKVAIENILSLFPTATADMPKISTPGSRPSYTSLHRFQDKLNANAMAIPYHKTNLGHLGLVLTTETYKNVNNNTAWTDPEEPSDNPTKPSTPKDKQTDPFYAQEAIRKWQRQTAIYTTFKLTQDALKNQILKNVDEEYINALEHDITKYSQVTPLELLTHLWSNYGAIEESDLSANEERMKQAWNPPTPIEELYKQLRDGQKFAKKGGEDITDSQLVRIGYDQVYKTGLFDKACAKWRRQALTDKTWKKFQAFFTIEVTDYLKNTTANEAQYTAAQVQEILDSNFAAYAAAASNQEPNTQANTNANHPPAANSLTEKDVEAIIQQYVKKTTGSTGNNSTTPTNTSTSKKPHKVRVAQGFNSEGDPISYCWSHGVTKNLSHNSMTCKRKKEGHQDKATLNDRKNGSDEVCEKRA